MSEYDGWMDLSDLGIKKYDMGFLGRPRFGTPWSVFGFWAGRL